MADIIIHNHGTVNIYNVNDTTVSEAKDKLLTKLYWARNKQTMGGYDAWLQLLDMYYAFDWQGMYNHIQSYKGKGKGGRTRNECLELLKTIMKDNH